MIYIYGLYLQGVCHYVGASADPFNRYLAHRFGGKFTGSRPVLRIFRSCSPLEAARLERQVTLAFHRKGQAKLSKVAGGYRSKFKHHPSPILGRNAQPYTGELLARKTFINARKQLCLKLGDAAKMLGVPSSELRSFEYGGMLSFEMLGRYAAIIRQPSRELEGPAQAVPCKAGQA